MFIFTSIGVYWRIRYYAYTAPVWYHHMYAHVTQHALMTRTRCRDSVRGGTLPCSRVRAAVGGARAALHLSTDASLASVQTTAPLPSLPGAQAEPMPMLVRGIQAGALRGIRAEGERS